MNRGSTLETMFEILFGTAVVAGVGSITVAADRVAMPLKVPLFKK